MALNSIAVILLSLLAVSCYCYSGTQVINSRPPMTAPGHTNSWGQKPSSINKPLFQKPGYPGYPGSQLPSTNVINVGSKPGYPGYPGSQLPSTNVGSKPGYQPGVNPGVGANNPARAQQWMQYKQMYRKMYPDPREDAMRQAIFEQNVAIINQHNMDPRRMYDLGINHLADWSDQEFSKMLGKRPTQAKWQTPGRIKRQANPCYHTGVTSDIINWSQISGPVGEQGSCGSCWAWTAADVMAARSRSPYPLSRQELVDCVYPHHDSCDTGGNPSAAYQYVYRGRGLATERAYPYTARGWRKNQLHTCQVQLRANMQPLAMKQYCQVPKTEKDLLNALQSGPVAIGISVTWSVHLRNFRFFRRGIINANCASIEHAVVLVGHQYDPNKRVWYWLFKNSWSTDWGEQGYGKLLSGYMGNGQWTNRNVLCVASDADFPLF